MDAQVVKVVEVSRLTKSVDLPPSGQRLRHPVHPGYCACSVGGNDAFADHGTVEDKASVLLVLDATGHQRRLGRVESGNGAAGDGDEDQRPDRQFFRMQIDEQIFDAASCREECLVTEDQSNGQHTDTGREKINSSEAVLATDLCVH